MADVQVTLSVEPEVQAIVDDLEKAVVDVKAKAGSSAYIQDGLKLCVDAGANFAALPADIKTKEALAYMGLGVGRIVADLLGYA